jgi:hypothetical protein
MSYPLTCVSGYFPVKNKHNNQYLEWFETTLDINCPYVFFTNRECVDMIKKFRKNYPTYFIICDIADFEVYKFKDRMISDPTHCPSVELNLIWNEKIFMVQKAFKINPFNSEFFMWIDSGICIYRNEKPPQTIFPDKNKLDTLPKDKFIFCSSKDYYNEFLVQNTNYYHYISGTFIMHKTCIDNFSYIYMTYMDTLVDKNNIWTEQVILTHIYKYNPTFFYKLRDGYGEIVKYLF